MKNQLSQSDPVILVGLGKIKQSGCCVLSFRGLVELPAEVGELVNLRELRLDGNWLTALRPEISRLSNLQELWLDDNQLSVLPREIFHLTNLQTLRLTSNRLTSIPPEIARLTKLKTLRLGGNCLASLPPEIGHLTNLETLLLNGNQLTAVPREIGLLTNLKRLTINQNRLTSVPAEIAQLASLQELRLDRNHLTSVPRQLADRLDSGLVLKLVGNPSLPPELLRRGARDVAVYLRSLEDAVTQYEAKVLLLGEGNVGKTSLSAALRGEPFIEGRPFTHGIEIRPLTLRHPAMDADMTMRIWDFGGQEIYRITHQFFFSRQGLYLVVWKPREGQRQNEVEGWLRRTRLRAGQDTRLLVVATHCPDEQRPDLDYWRLQPLFPQLPSRHFEVDNKTGRGIGKLLKAIGTEAARLPQMGQIISPRWTAVRKEIAELAESEPQISFEKFTAICRRQRVVGEEVTTLATLMHEVGQIIYYGDDDSLRDFIVLNPEWLTKAISYVLHDNPSRAAGGQLHHGRLREIWQDRLDGTGYPSRYHRYFLRLMEKFDITYRVDEHQSLVAQLVPSQRPKLPWDFSTPVSVGSRRLAFVYRLRERAPGLMAWLTVKRHLDSAGLHWRTGVFLRHQNPAYASEALLELRTSDQLDLTVEVRAPSPDLFFHVLWDTIEQLVVSRWPGLQYEMLVPCPSIAPSGSRCTGLIPMNMLIAQREEEGMPDYLCPDCRCKHSVHLLLTGFPPPGGVMPTALDLLERITGEFDRLESHAADLADGIRQVLRAVSAEVDDCPLLFTLTRGASQGRRRLRVDQLHFRLTLWCEHPGHLHPWPEASYLIDQPREWLVRISPYLNTLLTILRSAVPAVASAAGVFLTPEELTHAQNELQLMSTLASQLPNVGTDPLPSSLREQDPGAPTRAQGQAMRAIRTVIFQHDPGQAFGDMRRVLTAAGDYLWICPDHYSSYELGLPTIPGS